MIPVSCWQAGGSLSSGTPTLALLGCLWQCGGGHVVLQAQGLSSSLLQLFRGPCAAFRGTVTAAPERKRVRKGRRVQGGLGRAECEEAEGDRREA